jgi:pimeloyl-ACP methyl ester carboxylesterase
MWRGVTSRLRAAGRRTIAVDLPGFGESSAPRARSQYRGDRVLEQLTAVLSALGVREPVDVVGHDWGAYLTWLMCLARPDLVRRHVAVSVGHPRAFLLAGWDQKRRSNYMLALQLPGISERALSADGFRRLRAYVAGQHPDIETVVEDLSRPGRLTAGLTWYRANYLPAAFRRWPRCSVPTLGIWPSADKFLGEEQMFNSGRYMTADWKYVRLGGVGHWAPLQAPEPVAELTLDWVKQPTQLG